LYYYFVSHSSEFWLHNPLCCFSVSVYCCRFTPGNSIHRRRPTVRWSFKGFTI